MMFGHVWLTVYRLLLTQPPTSFCTVKPPQDNPQIARGTAGRLNEHSNMGPFVFTQKIRELGGWSPILRLVLTPERQELRSCQSGS